MAPAASSLAITPWSASTSATYFSVACPIIVVSSSGGGERRRLAVAGPGVRHMARDAVARLGARQHRFACRADVLRERAAGPEPAARRRVDRVRRIAGERRRLGA